MRSVSAIARVLVVTCMLSVLGVVAYAQELPGRVAAVDTTPVRMTLTGGGAGSFNVGSDVFFGAGVKGPYNLSWKGINRFSDSVSVDNRIVHRDFDYQIDYSSGTITFTEPVSDKSLIRVDYSYDSSKAVPNRAPFKIPITLDLMKRDNAGLQFTALYREADPNAESAPDVFVYGLTGDSKAGEGEFSSMLLFSPERSGQNGRGEGSFADRSVIKLGGSTKTDKVRLNTSYLRVGEQFTGAKDYKLQEGMESVDVAAVFTPNEALTLSSSFARSENAAGPKKGESVASSEHRIVLNPAGAPKLTAVHTEVAKEKPGTVDQRTTTDKLQLKHKLASDVSAVASHETVTADIGGSETRVTTSQLAVSAKPADNLDIRGRLTQKASSQQGEETNISLDIEAKPTKTLDVKAAMSHTDAGTVGDEFAHTLKVVSTPRPDTRLEATMSGRDVERPEDESARAVRFSTSALEKTSVQIDWAQKDSEVKGSEEFGAIRVESSPSRSVKVSGALSQRETRDTRDLSREARVELRPFSHTTLGGAYKESESNGEVVSRISEVSASTKPSSFIALSGAYKSRETLGQDNLNSVDLALQLDTGGLLKFTGAYAANPEDRKGVVQRLNSQSIGLRSDFGRLKLKGAYTLKDEYLVGRRGEMTEIGLDYRLSAYSLLTTGYSLEEYQEASNLATSVYSFGFTHNIGTRLNLYLGGKMTTYERDRRLAGSGSEYEAEARLGLKF